MNLCLQISESAEKVKDIVAISDATVEGILIGFCILLAVFAFYNWRKLNKVQEDRVNDAKEFMQIAQELINKTEASIHQTAEIAKRNEELLKGRNE